MMGSNDKPRDELFYSFNLSDVVPENHLLPQIDRLLDFSELREHLAPYYSRTGRPSIDPELMIRMLLIGYCLGIRSDRQLCMEVKLNLAYRWFCKLSISDSVPDHSTFSKNRHGRFRRSAAFRQVFEKVLQRCIEAGLIGGESFAVDASVVKADASRQRHHEDDSSIAPPTPLKKVSQTGSMDVCPRRSSLLSLFHKLSGGHEGWRDCGCRSDAGQPVSGGRIEPMERSHARTSATTRQVTVSPVRTASSCTPAGDTLRSFESLH